MTTELSNPHDRFFKEVWSRKDISHDFLRCYLPKEGVALLDLKSLALVKGSFVDPPLRENHSDRLYRLRLKTGEPVLAHVLLEHKRQAKRATPLQLLGYIVPIWQEAVE
jgi:predicted transposase/invertase (TIGR01784 family)